MSDVRESGRYTYFDLNIGEEVTVPVIKVESDGKVEKLAADCLAHPMTEERYRKLAAEGKSKGH